MVFKMALLFVLEKRNVFVFSVGKFLRLFEVIKMIFKKCIRIVKGTFNLSSTMVSNFVIRHLYRCSYKMCSI